MKIIEDPRSYVLLMAILASFLTPFVASSINVALPSIGLEFAMDPFVLAWVPTAYLLAVGNLLIPMGRLADIYGRRIFQFGIILFTVSSIFAGFPFLRRFYYYGLFKVLGAMIFSNISAIIFSVFPPVERGHALGWSATGTYFWIVFLAPPLEVFLTQYFGWRTIFYFNVPLGALCAYAIGKIGFEWREADGERFDFLAASLMASSLILVIVGFSLVRSFHGLLFFHLGGLFYPIFYDSPLFDARLFENRSFIWNGFITFISYFAGYPVIFLLNLYLQYFHGLNPWKTGMILAIQPILIALVSPVVGKLSDKKSPEGVAATGIVIIVWAMAILSFLGSLYLIVLGLIFMGLGFFHPK